MWFRNQQVAGSIPAGGSIFIKYFHLSWLWFWLFDSLQSLIVLLTANVPPSDDQRRAERIVGLLKLVRHFTQCAKVPELVLVVY